MTEKNYAFIKDNSVVNIVVFDDPSNDTLNHFKNEFNVDEIILATEKAIVNGTYDGEKFWLIKPFNSWIKNEQTNEWEAPILAPNDGKSYTWDESSISWILD